jgi:hypothetical protein
MLTDRMVATGLTTPWPEMSGAEPVGCGLVGNVLWENS